MSSWDVFVSDRLEVLRGLSVAEIRAGLARGSLRDDDLVRPAGTKDPWARIADLPGVLEPEPESKSKPEPPPPRPEDTPAAPTILSGPPTDLDATLLDPLIKDLAPPPPTTPPLAFVPPSEAPTIPPWAEQAFPPVEPDAFAPPSDEHDIPPARPRTPPPPARPRIDPEGGSSKFEFDDEYGPRGERLFEELSPTGDEGLAAFRQWLDEEPAAPPTVEVDTPAAVAAAEAPQDAIEEPVEPTYDPLDEDEAAADFTLIPASGRSAEPVDLTAMVDVSFLLILFFLIAATTVYLKTLEVPEPNPERTEAAAVQPRTIEDLETDFILVEIDAAGTIRVDHEPVEATLPALAARLREARRVSGRTAMLLSAELRAMHRHAVLAYDAANEIGLRIAIARPSG